MASHYLPETVLDLELFIPETNDFFSIDAGGMPNGDDCLTVHGNVSRNYKAFVNASTLTPNIFLSRSDGPWAMSFWFKGANITYSTITVSQTLFAVMNSLCQNGGTDAGQVWTVSSTAGVAATANPIRFHQQRSSPTTGTGSYDGSVLVAQNKWIFVVINKPFNTTGGSGNNAVGTMYTRAEDAERETPTTLTGAGSGSGSGSPGIGPGMKLCIGAYSDIGNANGRDGEWRLGKLAFHDHMLTLTERSLMFNSMVEVPG